MTISRSAEEGGSGVRLESCPGCSEQRLSPFLAVSPPFRLVECPACGLVSTDPRLGFAEMARFYPPTYYGRRNDRFHPVLEALVRFFRGRRADAIARHVAGPARLLDVGCGRGLLPYLMRERGWDVLGTEISDQAAEGARSRNGVPVLVGDLLDLAIPDGSRDVVVLWHVLEHVSKPVEAIRRAFSILPRGGLLVVAVPNISSLQARFSGASWFHLDIPRHYSHFRSGTLEELLRREGFDVLEVRHFSFEQNVYGWIQSFLNRAGFSENLLYEALKREGARAREDHFRLQPIALGVTALLLPFLVPLGVALSVLEAALRRGGTVELYARRREGRPAAP